MPEHIWPGRWDQHHTYILILGIDKAKFLDIILTEAQGGLLATF